MKKIGSTLMDEDEAEADDERLWLSLVSKNPAFTFLSDPEEDIYGAEDGAPLK